MTKLLFIRHAESDSSIKDAFSRPLTSDGVEKAKNLVSLLKGKEIDAFYSSPYIRSVHTIQYLADSRNVKITKDENLRERNVGTWVEDFWTYAEKQWTNFNFKESGGESLNEVQERNIKAVNNILKNHLNQTVVIGTHGTALCTILNYFNKELSFEFFKSMAHKMPFLVELTFDDEEYKSMEVL